MVRIVHIGLGPLGRRILADFHARGMGQVVGAVDLDPALAGEPLSALVPGMETDVRIVGSVEELGELDHVRCAIVTTSSDLERCMDTFRALLARKVDVISTCEELSWPWLRHRILAAELHELALKAYRRVLGTGINPGFLMDTLPVALTGVCNDVRSISAWRIQDASTRRVPFQAKIGAGLDDAAFEARRVEGRLRHVGLGESLHFIAHAMGWELERWDETLEPVRAETDLECALGPIPKGRAAGVRQVAEGWRDGAVAVRLVFQAAIGQADPHDRVLVDGDPPLDVVVKGGVHGDVATSAVVLNSIDALRAAEPGLHTMATIRPPHFRFGPDAGARA